MTVIEKIEQQLEAMGFPHNVVTYSTAVTMFGMDQYHQDRDGRVTINKALAADTLRWLSRTATDLASRLEG